MNPPLDYRPERADEQQPAKDMNIDFHYGVIYIVARVAGMNQAQAATVAHACQYIDDATTHGLLFFKGGEMFDRFASAHAVFDYNNIDNDLNRLVWAPFHFLPAGQGASLEEKAICGANSDIAKETVRQAIRSAHTPNALHRLGVTLHSYVDTWAHQGFSGIESKVNRVNDIEVADLTPEGWAAKLLDATKHLINGVATDVLSRFFPLGHGAALHYPDQPWALWSYVNGNGQKVERNNLPDFLEAADMACRAIRGYLAGNEAFELLPGLPWAQKSALEGLLASNRSEDGEVRLQHIYASVPQGCIPDLSDTLPVYIAKGKGSWKHAATGLEVCDDGLERPLYHLAFEQSDYRYFHDAVKEHRFAVTQDILPRHGLRIA